MTKITIRSIFGQALGEWDGETVAEALANAVADGANLRSANLRRANLRSANLVGADLVGADLRSANLVGADLRRANLRRANLVGADLRSANLRRANLRRANLRRANLVGADGSCVAVMPDGRTWDAYRCDHLAGLCDDPDVRERAISAWGNHSWGTCPMSKAHGWSGLDAVPEDRRAAVATWVALYDAGLLECPAPVQP
jgi:hypothetical protein